jgi:hypothetical protein
MYVLGLWDGCRRPGACCLARAAHLQRDALARREGEWVVLLRFLIGGVDNEGVRGNVDAGWASKARRGLAEVRLGVLRPVP